MDRQYFDLSWTKTLDQAQKARISEFFESLKAEGLKGLLCDDELSYEVHGPDGEFVSRRPISILFYMLVPA